MALIVYQIGSKKMENGAASALYFFVHTVPLLFIGKADTAMPSILTRLFLGRRQIVSAAVSSILLQRACKNVFLPPQSL